MTVDVQREGDGHWRFQLGPVEKWIVGLGAMLIVSGGYWFVSSLNERMDTQASTLQGLVTQQAVTNGQLAALQANLADVPSIRGQVTELKVRVDRTEQDVKELHATRGLR